MTLLFALRRRVPTAGAADPDGAGRAGDLGRARLETPLCDRRHVRVAAVLTPPDVVSQTSLAIPLIILYEVSIFSCRMVERARAKREAEEEAGLAGGGKPAPGSSPRGDFARSAPICICC